MIIREPWDRFRTIQVFWIRRLFRIAPLYYVVLLTAIAIAPWLGEQRSFIAQILPSSATNAERYADQSLENVLLHLSFMYGFLPSYSVRTPLPDWSISLEMQFYALFPAIMFFVWRVGAIRTTIAIIVSCVALFLLTPKLLEQFEMPTMLPMKLYLFMAGIWIALARQQESMRTGLIVSLITVAIWVAIDHSIVSLVRVVMVIAMFYLSNNDTLPASDLLRRVTRSIRKLLSSKPSKFFGDTSYAVYLFHWLILLPIAFGLAHIDAFWSANSAARFVVCTVAVVPIVYLGAWLLHVSIEKPGIKIGKAIVERLKRQAALQMASK